MIPPANPILAAVEVLVLVAHPALERSHANGRLLHAILWHGMPPLMKLWLDASIGSPEDSCHPTAHNRCYFDAFLPTCEQTSSLCGMRFLESRPLHGAHRIG